MAKQWKCQDSKQLKRFFKIHQQTNTYYSLIFGKNYAAIHEKRSTNQFMLDLMF